MRRNLEAIAVWMRDNKGIHCAAVEQSRYRLQESIAWLCVAHREFSERLERLQEGNGP